MEGGIIRRLVGGKIGPCRLMGEYMKACSPFKPFLCRHVLYNTAAFLSLVLVALSSIYVSRNSLPRNIRIAIMIYSTAISSAALLALASAVPTPIEKRADSCGQWDTIETGSYTVYNNLWGQGSADSGSQCFGVDGLNGNSISWHASWSWSGGANSKSRTSRWLHRKAI